MDHLTIQKKLFEFVDKGLPGPEQQEIAGHLEGCRDCARTVSRLEAVHRLLAKGLPQEDPEGFVSRVMKRVEDLAPAGEPAQGWIQPLWGFRERWIPDWSLPGLGVAAAALFFLMVVPAQEPDLSTEAILLSGISEESRWFYAQSEQEPELFSNTEWEAI